MLTKQEGKNNAQKNTKSMINACQGSFINLYNEVLGEGQDARAWLDYPFGLSIHTLIHQSSSTDASDAINIALWDIGGQASLRSFWRTYYSPLVHCLIFVIDLSDVHRMGEGVQWLYRMYQEVNECHGGEDMRTITKMVVIGNKSDLCTHS